ncbi:MULTISPECIES: RNA polymerase recycling motor HelD [unclassified Clostridium]|uniref:RNA polymerase recycling motor HelD n=1 Tax=unclassified Clostridium TaxID=2614128 RepID=UPI0018971ACC|nr:MULTISPECIES: RNA polymerase recycling motor HelD [unclassified Clostridium]MCR1952302.1 UvrD-helicase domain-containing protein [Clostridium sp. DSM 100503]
MNNNLKLEQEILKEKRKKIDNELLEKKKSYEVIEGKLKALTKESKGNYNEEKETTEKIYSVLKKDIKNYEEAIKVPYFGRVDFRELRGQDESIYIGKQSVSSTIDGEEIVVDWRTPVADLYYSGTGGYAYYKSPLGIIEGNLSLKRKFLFKEDSLNEIFDEGINEIIVKTGDEGNDLVDEFLKINLEESRGKKLKEVVATIQKEQNDIIRWPKNLPIIVQGSAGSGKTTIALHRLAYLIYRYSETMKGKDILVLAPNKLFLDYISDILPNLGVDEVNQTTFQDLVLKHLKIRSKVKGKDEKLKELIESDDAEKCKLIINSSKIKGTLAFKSIIDRYIALLESDSVDITDIMIGDYLLFNKREIMRLYLKDLKNFPINKRKDEIKRYLGLKLKERIEVLCLQVDLEWDIKIKEIKIKQEDCEDRRKQLIQTYSERDEIKNNIKNNSKKEMNEYFKSWRGITSKDIYVDLFKNEDFFELATLNKIPKELSQFMKEEIISNYNKGIIDEDDLAPLLYINILLEGVEEKEKYSHIVVDEAQDYNPFQIYLVNRLTRGNSLTLVGDIAQGIYYYKGIKNWSDIVDKVFDGKATYMQLTQSYRSTVEIIDFANGALDAQELDLKRAKPVLRHGELPKIIKCNNSKDAVKNINDIITEVMDKGKSSIAIITKGVEEGKTLEKLIKKNSQFKATLIKGNEKEHNDDILIIPSYLTKGLEFDATIIYNPSKSNFKNNLLDQRLLYVSLTRALHYEYIIEVDNITDMIKI